MYSNRLSILIYLTVVFAVAGSLKWHYSTADVNELRWILAPTTIAVEIAGGGEFDFERYSGYMSADKSFLIAAPCAGVNFLIVCFLTLAIRKLKDGRLIELPLMLLVSYGWTVIANAARILVALQWRGERAVESWIGAEATHRIQGITIYFAFLLVLYLAAERLADYRNDHSLSGSYLFVLIPLFSYYMVTLVLPLLNGAYDKGANGHFISVLLVPLAVASPGLLISLLSGCRQKKRGILSRADHATG